MKASINNTLLASIKFGDKPYDIRDDKLVGFLIRVNISGKLVYMCEYARGKRITIGRVGVLTPAQAHEKAKQLLSQAAIGVLPVKTKSSNQITLEQFIKGEYGIWRKAHRKNGKHDLRRLEVNFLPDFGDMALSDISPVLIEKWRTKRINDGIQHATVNRDIVILKSALTKALEWDILKDHPLRRLKLQNTDASANIRYLSYDEEMRLYNTLKQRDRSLKDARARSNAWRSQRGYPLFPDLNQVVYADHLAPMILLSLNTGLRQGELFNLR